MTTTGVLTTTEIYSRISGGQKSKVKLWGEQCSLQRLQGRLGSCAGPAADGHITPPLSRGQPPSSSSVCSLCLCLSRTLVIGFEPIQIIQDKIPIFHLMELRIRTWCLRVAIIHPKRLQKVRSVSFV